MPDGRRPAPPPAAASNANADHRRPKGGDPRAQGTVAVAEVEDPLAGLGGQQFEDRRA
jgi:hypothetical protein